MEEIALSVEQFGLYANWSRSSVFGASSQICLPKHNTYIKVLDLQ